MSCSTDPGASEPFAKPVFVDIERGTTTYEIAESLETRGVIRSKWDFIVQRVWNRDATLMAGEYKFEAPLDAEEAFRIIAQGKVVLYPITVPEGLNRFEVADVVSRSGQIDRAEFLAMTADPSPVLDLFPNAETLEGALFPETYNLTRDSTATDLVSAMVGMFRDQFSIARGNAMAEIANWNALILASMIEKETFHPEERGLVSSVFHNRIRLGMRMQCDPTVAYGLILDGRYRGRIFRSDLSDPHPYNTYVHEGLPPGPIASPGRDSLRAAFTPEESDYLFFVAKPGVRTGHVFSESLVAHNHAVRDLRKYQRTLR